MAECAASHTGPPSLACGRRLAEANVRQQRGAGRCHAAGVAARPNRPFRSARTWRRARPRLEPPAVDGDDGAAVIHAHSKTYSAPLRRRAGQEVFRPEP